MAFVSLAHIMAYRSNAMPLFQHETEARTKHLHSILLFTNLPFAPEKCYLRWMLHYGAISGIGWVPLGGIEHLTVMINTPILKLRLLPELALEKAKTDERIPLFLWPSAMVGFEEDEEGAGPCHHDPGQSSDVK